ncbi:MAG: NAD(P)/FAD-dependent oxidoreductase [Pseudomonadota bacterium]
MLKLIIVVLVVSAVGATALIFGRGWYTKLSDSSPENLVEQINHGFDGDVLIVGAGASGLAAANALERNGVDFTILEATDHYGGRVQKNEEFADFPIDLGAEWIHYDAPILNRLIGSDADNPPVELISYVPSEIYSWDGQQQSPISKVEIRLGQWSFPEYKFKTTTWYDFVDRHFAQPVKDRIVFNQVVTNIDYSGDGVVITTQEGEAYAADKVIVTVSPGVLQRNLINFVPALTSEWLEAIDSIQVLPGFKLFLKFKRDFYADIVEHVTEDGDRTYIDAAFGKDSKDHVMAVLVTGPVANRYYDMGDEQAIVEGMITELDVIYNGQASDAFTGDSVMTDWGRHAYTLGTWTGDTGSEEEMQLLRSPLENKVYFTGASLQRHGQEATVHGAIMSGYDVVSDLLRAHSD